MYMNLITLTSISKKYKNKQIFTNVNLKISQGDFVLILGESGAGKSTLLNIIAALERPTSGQILIEGQDIWQKSAKSRTDFYRHEISIIFQNSYLQPQLTIRDNIALPGIFAGASKEYISTSIEQLADELKIAESLDRLPQEISGGQAERACIARALLLKPKIILADEPTANLDAKNAQRVLEILNEVRKNRNITILVASHDSSVRAFANHVVTIRDGVVIDENQ